MTFELTLTLCHDCLTSHAYLCTVVYAIRCKFQVTCMETGLNSHLLKASKEADTLMAATQPIDLMMLKVQNLLSPILM